jgi:hypothetical protein
MDERYDPFYLRNRLRVNPIDGKRSTSVAVEETLRTAITLRLSRGLLENNNSIAPTLKNHKLTLKMMKFNTIMVIYVIYQSETFAVTWHLLQCYWKHSKKN